MPTMTYQEALHFHQQKIQRQRRRKTVELIGAAVGFMAFMAGAIVYTIGVSIFLG